MIYIIEDNKDYRDELREFLEKSGIQTSCGGSISDLEELIRNKNTFQAGDIVLLDLMLGVDSAFEFIQKIGATPAACIVLTGSMGETEKIIGLELGADDYVSKTCTPREILARIRSVKRRLEKSSNLQVATNSSGNNGWYLDKSRLAVIDPAGSDLQLTVAEFKLLACLIDAEGEPVSREKLVRIVLRKAYDPSDRSIDNLVSRIRNKFRARRAEAETIKSARHLGYIFLGFPPISSGSASNTSRQVGLT